MTIVDDDLHQRQRLGQPDDTRQGQREKPERAKLCNKQISIKPVHGFALPLKFGAVYLIRPIS